MTIPFNPDQVKHLEMIQAIVTRLANNGFLIKGWALTVSAAFIAVVASKPNWKLALAALLPLLAFWLLDTYYLEQERAFRMLYDDARQRNTTVEIFSMNISSHLLSIKTIDVMFSPTLKKFYGIIMFVHVAILLGITTSL